MFFGILAEYANKNYLRIEIAKKLYNYEFKHDFKSIFNLYKIDESKLDKKK